MGQQCVEQPEQLRSEDQITRENAGAPLRDAIIAFGRSKAGQRIDGVHEQTIATESICFGLLIDPDLNIGMTLAIARAPRTRGQW